jgi:ubiquinone/menaquinone biosynthesis C-methylase UbiE
MSVADQWKGSLRAFFHERAEEISGRPTVQDLCFISGREPRMWSDPEMRADLAASILSGCGVDQSSKMLEVGCAAGFLAQLIAPHVKSYEGVDLAPAPLRVARRLGLSNANFRKADGERLPYPDGRFDAAFCYDVYTNFPAFEDGAGLISEMLRVVKPGGRVLVGSIPDAEMEMSYPDLVSRVVNDLETRYGPSPARPAPVPGHSLWTRLLRRYGPAPVVPEIICYYFKKRDFQDLARKLNVAVEICEIHERNPYLGYRFNAIYSRAA